MKVFEVEIGDEFTHPEKGLGKVIGKTKLTMTIIWKHSTSKIKFKNKDQEFNILEV